MKLTPTEIDMVAKLVAERERQQGSTKDGRPGSLNNPQSLAQLIAERRKRLQR